MTDSIITVPGRGRTIVLSGLHVQIPDPPNVVDPDLARHLGVAPMVLAHLQCLTAEIQRLRDRLDGRIVGP